MFLRFVSQSIRRSPRRKAMTVAAVAMGTAVATAMLGVMLDIGDRVNRELRSLGANLMVTPKARSLPVEIGGISYRPVSSQDFIPEDQVQKIKSTFWQLNITGFAPSLKAAAALGGRNVPVEGVWFRRRLRGADGSMLEAGLRTVNGEWKVDGRWIDDRDRNDAALDAMLGGAVARRLGLKPGDTLQLFGQPFTVAGIVSTGRRRRRPHLRAAGSPAAPGQPPRTSGRGAGGRAHQAGGRIRAQRSHQDDAQGIRPLVLHAVHQLHRAPDRGSAAHGGGAAHLARGR